MKELKKDMVVIEVDHILDLQNEIESMATNYSKNKNVVNELLDIALLPESVYINIVKYRIVSTLRPVLRKYSFQILVHYEENWNDTEWTVYKIMQ